MSNGFRCAEGGWYEGCGRDDGRCDKTIRACCCCGARKRSSRQYSAGSTQRHRPLVHSTSRIQTNTVPTRGLLLFPPTSTVYPSRHASWSTVNLSISPNASSDPSQPRALAHAARVSHFIPSKVLDIDDPASQARWCTRHRSAWTCIALIYLGSFKSCGETHDE
ncbi:hypothetical protein PENSPDRAFT_361314 [Peniophora sp. CONT]|nr:hypothetical protein PENSPDRAFT_361314 [Peniophora sp. CONT]